MKQNGTRIENKTLREIMNVDRRTKLKRLLWSYRRAARKTILKLILQNSKPAEFCQQNHVNIRLFGE